MSSLFDQFFNKNKENREPGQIDYVNEKPENQDTLKIKATVYGRVQGVGFRYSTSHLAKELDVAGVVQNQADGTVYVEAVGNREAMEQFILELAKGPSPSADVEKVTIEYDNSIPDYTSFSQDR